MVENFNQEVHLGQSTVSKGIYKFFDELNDVRIISILILRWVFSRYETSWLLTFTCWFSYLQTVKKCHDNQSSLNSLKEINKINSELIENKYQIMLSMNDKDNIFILKHTVIE